MTKILFHYPGPFYDELDSGEKKRPKKMREAFEKIGCEVIECVGDRKTRERCFSEISRELGTLDFIYSETSTLPLALTEPNHLPKWPCLDYRLFYKARAQRIPVGVFYRDIYWQFSSFIKSVGILKAVLGRPFYKSELKLYAKTANAVFVPSNEFGTYLSSISFERIIALPPGGDVVNFSKKKIELPLRLVYVGAIQPPIYDLTNLFTELSKLNDIPLTCDIVTKKNEWQKYAAFYDVPSNVRITHLVGVEVENLLKECHISLLYFNDDPYRHIAQPLKLYEAVGFGLPLVTREGTSAASVIMENQFGWVIGGEINLLGSLLKRLVENLDEVNRIARNVWNQRHLHTWEARARKALEILTRAT